jgi:hypothetical protein
MNKERQSFGRGQLRVWTKAQNQQYISLYRLLDLVQWISSL